MTKRAEMMCHAAMGSLMSLAWMVGATYFEDWAFVALAGLCGAVNSYNFFWWREAQ